MYCTVEDIINNSSALKDLYDRGVISDNKILNWIYSSQAIIDAYLSLRYHVPFPDDNVPPIVKTLTIELVDYFSQKDIHTPTSSGDEVPWLYPRYKNIMKILEDLRDGRMVLTDKNGNKIEPSKRLVNILNSNHLNISQIFSMKNYWETEVDENYGENE